VRRYAEWSVRSALASGADIRLNTEATRARIEAESPDVVLVAAGSEPFIPKIPGIDGENVLLAADIDLGRGTAGKRVVLVGAGLTGTETAVALARAGHGVTLIDALELEEIDARAAAPNSGVLRALAREAGVVVKTGLRAAEITGDGLLATDRGGAAVALPCDTVVLSMGVRPRVDLARSLAGIAAEVVVLGDCAAKSGNITSAVRDGFYAAMNI
jgi:pyruvate/2-oxoglutarate dehydrogenase complex dihydrolipoamide dehydrogenase (E3) component